MAMINDYAATGVRYIMGGREKRNVTDWCERVDRLERKAYLDPAGHVFRQEIERRREGEILEITRIICGPRGQERVMFEVHRNAEGIERRREAFSSTEYEGEGF